jgi:hypothetical protein
MLTDAIRSIVPPVIPDAAPPRATKQVRLQVADPPSTTPRPPVTSPVPTPEPRDEVKLQWDSNNGVIIKFTDTRSGDVVRQIPSEQVLSVVRFIREMLQAEGARTNSNVATGSTPSPNH